MRECERVIRMWQVAMLTGREAVQLFIQAVEPDRIDECLKQADSEFLALLRRQVEGEPSTDDGWREYWYLKDLMTGTLSGESMPAEMPNDYELETHQLEYQNHSRELRKYFERR